MSEDKELSEQQQEEAGWVSLTRAINISDSEAEDELRLAEDRATVKNLLSKLNYKERLVIKYHFLKDLTYEQTGEMLGLKDKKQSTARLISEHALTKMRRILLRDRANTH